MKRILDQKMPSKKGITMNQEEWKNLLAVQYDVKFSSD